MTTKPPYALAPGYKWCQWCQAPYIPSYGYCPKHELERTVTLTRHEAKLLFDLSVLVGYAPVEDMDEQIDNIHAFLAGLDAERYALAVPVMTPEGIGWKVITREVTP